MFYSCCCFFGGGLKMRSRRRKRNVQISPPLAASSGTTRGYDKIIFVVIVNEYGMMAGYMHICISGPCSCRTRHLIVILDMTDHSLLAKFVDTADRSKSCDHCHLSILRICAKDSRRQHHLHFSHNVNGRNQ